MRDELLTWLEAAARADGCGCLDVLRVLHLDRFTVDSLRTVQRFMKVRRLTKAREVLLGPVPDVKSTVLDAMGAEDTVWAGGETKAVSNISS